MATQMLFTPSTRDKSGSDRHIYRVSELNRDVQALLESAFPLLWVEGEISNLSMPASGHWYFTLKDPQAQVRCAMFKNRNRATGFIPENGQHVIVKVRVGLYEPRGDYQLLVETMEPAGDGALQSAFEALKKRLQAEGLFDTAHKKPLPALPRQIGVITSPTGAAIRDILSVLQRRFPAIPVLIYPVAVQGESAGAQIAKAIDSANARNECDVLIVARGGGSLEDLWAFNEEVVARAIYASAIPIVAGIGHEIDFTIADFVADQRAPTPSAAAEMVVPDGNEWLVQTARYEKRLISTVLQQLRLRQERLRWLETRLVHPSRKLQQWAQGLDELEQRLHRSFRHRQQQQQLRLDALTSRLMRQSPLNRIEKLMEKQSFLQQRLFTAQHRWLQSQGQSIAHLAKRLETVSPLATLSRGYSIVFKEDGSIVRTSAQVQTGDRVLTRLGEGQLRCVVEGVENE